MDINIMNGIGNKTLEYLQKMKLYTIQDIIVINSAVNIINKYLILKLKELRKSAVIILIIAMIA